MTTRATATFDIDTWEEEPRDQQEGPQFGHVLLTKTFHGDVEGHSSVEMLTAATPDGDGRAYVAFERIAASVNGRSGTFILRHSATASSGGQQATWTVLPRSGNGELRGLRGDAQIVVEPDGLHRFTLDYDLE